MGEEENKRKRLKFFADLERKGISFLNPNKSERLKSIISSDIFKYFLIVCSYILLLGIYVLIVIASLFKIRKKNDWILEFLYEASDYSELFPFLPKYLNIDSKSRLEYTREEHIKRIEQTLFSKIVYLVSILIQVFIVLLMVSIFLFIVIEPLENLFGFIENSFDNTSEIITSTAKDTSKIIATTAKDTAEILNSTADNLKQRSYMNDLKNIFHGIKEFFHSMRESKESAIKLWKEIIQLWKEA